MDGVRRGKGGEMRQIYRRLSKPIVPGEFVKHIPYLVMVDGAAAKRQTSDAGRRKTNCKKFSLPTKPRTQNFLFIVLVR